MNVLSVYTTPETSETHLAQIFQNKQLVAIRGRGGYNGLSDPFDPQKTRVGTDDAAGFGKRIIRGELWGRQSTRRIVPRREPNEFAAASPKLHPRGSGES